MRLRSDFAPAVNDEWLAAHLEKKEETMISTASTPQRLYLMQVATMPLQPTALSFGCYLVQMGDGKSILVDSGLPSSNTPSPTGMPVPTRGRNVIEQLTTIDLLPDDIDFLICTHFDSDHAGNHAAFPNAQFIVQRQHYEAALSAHPRFAAVRSQWDLPAFRYRLVEGDLELLPGIDLIETSGHVPGHQSILVRLPELGPVLLAVDAVRMQADFTHNRSASPMDLDPERAVASTRKLVDLAQQINVSLVVFGHDGQQWQTLRKLPDYYD